MTDRTNGKLSEALKFARQHKEISLIRCLKQLKREERHNPGMDVKIANDHAPQSFYFEKWKDARFLGNGGIIFHGFKGEFQGGAPTFSVCVGEPDPWEIHT